MEYTTFCPNCQSKVIGYKNPFPAADIAAIRDGKVLLILRKNPPEGWALPGGFIDYGESAEAAAVRELREETGMEASSLRLVGVYSKPGRDARFHTLSVVYRAEASGDLTAGDDACDAQWFPVDNLPEQVAFDHRQVIQDALVLS